MKITAPAAGFTGTTHLGPYVLKFEDGVAEVDDLNDGAKAYLRANGYGLGSRKATQPEDTTEPADPRDYDLEVVGTPLRDAAVDPRPGDFLAPTNAGKANPHGPDVVSPGIHANQGVRPVKGGDVHVDDPAKQDAAETEHTETTTSGEPIVGIVVPEGDLDARVAWVAEADDSDEARRRADAVYAHEQEAGDTDLDELGARLTNAVYGEPDGGTADDGSRTLKGEALDAALEERGLPKSGTADEKRARVAEHDAKAKGQD